MRTAGFFLIGAAFSFLAGWAFCGAIEGRGFEFWAAAVGAVPGGVSAFWIGLSRTGVLR